MDGAVTKTENSPSFTITAETDRVYTPAGGPESPVVISEGGKKLFEIVRDNLNEVVVWNPWADKSGGMGDFQPKSGWKNMICVEAGAVNGWQKLDAGEAFDCGQVIKASL